MKIYLTILFFLLPFLLCAQLLKTKHKQKSTVPKQSIEEFYSGQCLQLDSACSPFLYYQVYDWIGTHYKYSGKTKKGIDCSGFVTEMYRNTYCIQLSGGSAEIWPSVKPVEKNELQEGDILFFKIRKGKISHVGIYLENNKFAHASVKSGVIISDLNEDYYKKYFYKGGRIVDNKKN